MLSVDHLTDSMQNTLFTGIISCINVFLLLQADNDLRKFLAMREQALSNRDPGSDQEISRDTKDDSENLEKGLGPPSLVNW